MRIIAGSAKGRNLKVPRGLDGTRPTSDRVKETIFNVLGQWLDGEEVLDLYAGVGGLGLEAISRGAKNATLVDSNKLACEAIADNARTFGFAAQTTTLLKPVERAIKQLGSQGRTFSLVFSDPPYATHAGQTVLEQLAESLLVRPGGRVVVEHDKRETIPETVGPFTRVDERKFGDTTVSFYERPGAPESPTAG